MYTPLNQVGEGKLFRTNLIVLDDQGIDVILGLHWMNGHNTLLDVIFCIAHLDSATHGVVILQLPPPVTKHHSVHHSTA
jgi:hypothetical protein